MTGPRKALQGLTAPLKERLIQQALQQNLTLCGDRFGVVHRPKSIKIVDRNPHIFSLLA